MATALLPNLQAFIRDGETAIAALTRMAQESKSLETALTVLGVSLGDAQAAVKDLGLSAKTELIDAAGGLDAFNSKIGFFASNFLSAEEQLEISFASLDTRMRELGLSADISVEEFKNLIISVTKAGGVSVQLANELLNLQGDFLQVKRAQEQLANQSNTTGSAINGLTGSISSLGAATRASFQRIDDARANLDQAQKELAVAQAQQILSNAQARLSSANTDLSTARSQLAAAQSAEQSELSKRINDSIAKRSELISNYQQEAQALKSVVDQFGALSDKILDFKDSLNLSELSPFDPGEQLAIARQQLNVTRNQANAGDAKALEKLPDAVQEFLQASKAFNGANAIFESDFNFAQGVLASAAATPNATRNIAADQLSGIEATVLQLQNVNKAAQQSAQSLGRIDKGVLSVADAQAKVDSALADVHAAEVDVESANRRVEQAVIDQTGAIDNVGRATLAVEKAVRELGAAILQGFGNLAISDQQIRDFIKANPSLSDAQIIQKATQNGISASQLQRATGVSFERINRASAGLSVANQQISDFVDANINDPLKIYKAAIANGISSERLAASSQLSQEQINQFIRANNLRPFARGTDFVTQTGPVLAHRGEAITPAHVPEELKREVINLRKELAGLRREQNSQMSALINTNIVANHENAQAIAQANARLAQDNAWQTRNRAALR